MLKTKNKLEIEAEKIMRKYYPDFDQEVIEEVAKLYSDNLINEMIDENLIDLEGNINQLDKIYRDYLDKQ